jgi:hypothetical protein
MVQIVNVVTSSVVAQINYNEVEKGVAIYSVSFSYDRKCLVIGGEEGEIMVRFFF